MENLKMRTRTRNIILIISIVVALSLFGSNSITSNGPRFLPELTVTKRVVFVGYRAHWNQTRPYQCDCGGGLRLFVNSSEVPRDPRDIQSADLVIFAASAGFSEEIEWDKYHQYRQIGQKWLFATREAPSTLFKLYPPEKFRFNSFHWSYTYSPYSSFPSPYGRYFKSDFLYSDGEVDWTENKTEFISWTSSNCPLPYFKWHRRDFVLKLNKYINIDMFGKCGNLSCPRLSQSCFDKLKTYKFALVLENSCCPDYISEKFWKALARYYQVPVVLGAKREEYDKIAPPNSFISIEDFSSVKELAEYLKELDRDDTLYKQYHEWRNHGWAKTARLPNELVYHCDALCRIGRRLDDTSIEWNRFSFDPKGELWLGGCRSCDDAIRHLV